MHGMDQSLELTLPPLATIYLQLTGSVKKAVTKPRRRRTVKADKSADDTVKKTAKAPGKKATTRGKGKAKTAASEKKTAATRKRRTGRPAKKEADA